VHPCLTERICEADGESFGASERLDDPVVLGEGMERVAEIQAEVDGFSDALPAIRQVVQRRQCLVEVGDRLPMERP
jgi:hypothetical protein